MTERLTRYRKYASFIKSMLFCAGLWHGKNKDTFILYRYLPIFTVFSGILMMCGCLKFIQENVNNIKVFTKGLSWVASFYIVACKAFIFFLYRQQLRELNLILEPMFEEVLLKAQFQPVVLSMLNLFTYPTNMMYWLTVGVLLLYVTTPLILILYQVIKHVDPKRYGLPFPTSFPWIDGSTGVLYQMQYLFETQMSWFAVFVTCSVDCAYGLYIFQIIGVLRAMSYACETFTKSPTELDLVLRDCVKKQIKFLRCRDIIQTVYGPIVLGLIVTSAVILCSIIFQMFQTEISAGKMIIFLLYGMLKMTQAFMYSWYGSLVEAESEAFQRSVYSSEWYQHGNIILMKNALLVLSQKPIKLTACRFCFISLDLFIKILNTSLSYYFLLQTFDENNDKS